MDDLDCDSTEMSGPFIPHTSVLTPYGEGTVVSSQTNGIVVVTPKHWQLAGNQVPTYYLNRKDVTPKYKKGDAVTTAYGAGKITNIRTDGMYIVALTNWKLAQSQNPLIYMRDSGFLPPPKEEEFDFFATCLSKANEAKAKAGGFFKQGQIEQAKEHYLLCLKAIQSLSSDTLSNKQRAKVFDLTVTSSNNAALCWLRLKKYKECSFFASSALNLIVALEPRMGTGKVWQCLVKDGMTKDKIFKEWKKKSLFYIGKSELMRRNYQMAIERLKEALEVKREVYRGV